MVACFAKNIPPELAFGGTKSALSVEGGCRGAVGSLRNVCATQRRYCVKGSFCMICSIRNGAERLACLAGICITIPGIHYYFALTNDGRLGPRRDVFTGIFDKGRNLGPSSEEDRRTQAPFVHRVRPTESSAEILLPRQLTSASCFLFSFFLKPHPPFLERTVRVRLWPRGLSGCPTYSF